MQGTRSQQERLATRGRQSLIARACTISIGRVIELGAFDGEDIDRLFHVVIRILELRSGLDVELVFALGVLLRASDSHTDKIISTRVVRL